MCVLRALVLLNITPEYRTQVPSTCMAPRRIQRCCPRCVRSAMDRTSFRIITRIICMIVLSTRTQVRENHPLPVYMAFGMSYGGIFVDGFLAYMCISVAWLYRERQNLLSPTNYTNSAIMMLVLWVTFHAFNFCSLILVCFR